MTYDVRAVANFFLDQAQEEGQKLDHMKLQKLAYIAHGWHLAITGEPLFHERVEAWPYGPVIPDLYHELMPDNPKCKILTAERRKLITARWKQSSQLASGSVYPFGVSKARVHATLHTVAY